MAVIPYPHPPPCVCRASTGFGWTVTAYTAVLSSAGMAQGFAGPARLIPDALRVATGKVNAQTLSVWGGGERERIMTSYSGIWPKAASCVLNY